LTTILKNKHKIISDYQANMAVKQLKPSPGSGMELKRHFRNDLLQFGYNNSLLIVTFFLWSHKVTL